MQRNTDLYFRAVKSTMDFRRFTIMAKTELSSKTIWNRSGGKPWLSCTTTLWASTLPFSCILPSGRHLAMWIRSTTRWSTTRIAKNVIVLIHCWKIKLLNMKLREIRQSQIRFWRIWTGFWKQEIWKAFRSWLLRKELNVRFPEPPIGPKFVSST